MKPGHLKLLVVTIISDIKGQSDRSGGLKADFGGVQLFASSWQPHSLAHQPPLSMGIPRQEYWSGLPFPLLEDLPNAEIKPIFTAFPALAGGFFFTTEPPGKPKLQSKAPNWTLNFSRASTTSLTYFVFPLSIQ